MLTWSSKFTLPYPSSTAPEMTVIEEIDDANRLIHRGVNSKYIIQYQD